MSALLLALALAAAQDAPAAAPPTEPAPVVAAAEPTPVAEEPPFPVGAPQDDYGLVAWCYGALGGYLELHDRVLPEVTRIEDAFRRPGTSLAQDMQTYSDLQKLSRANMKLFARAMEAAERASLRPINARGALAVQKGRASWAGAESLPVRTVAQQWMGWALPARCAPTATTLEARAKLMGKAFLANEPEPEAPAPAPSASPETSAIADPTLAPATAPADQAGTDSSPKGN